MERTAGFSGVSPMIIPNQSAPTRPVSLLFFRGRGALEFLQLISFTVVVKETAVGGGLLGEDAAQRISLSRGIFRAIARRCNVM